VRTFLRHVRWFLAMGAGHAMRPPGMGVPRLVGCTGSSAHSDLRQHFRLQGDPIGVAEVNRPSSEGL